MTSYALAQESSNAVMHVLMRMQATGNQSCPKCNHG